MRVALVISDSSLRVLTVPGEPALLDFIEIANVDDAARLLRPFQTDPVAMARLRAALAEDATTTGSAALPPEQLIQQTAHRLVARKMFISRPDRPRRAMSGAEDAPPAPAPPGPTPKKKLTWIEIQVINKETDDPIPWVRMAVKLPTGEEAFHTTDNEGLIRIDDIDPGTCDAKCDLKNARRTDTFGFIDMAPPGGPPQKKMPKGDSSFKRIANVDKHKVKTGETLDGLAKGATLAKSDLTKFNWDTDAPDQVNECLADVVGCTKTDADGSYVLDSSDKPGIVLVPSKWSETGLATGKRHTFRVEMLPEVKRVWIIEMEHLHFHFDSAVLLADYLSDDPNAETAPGEHVTALSVLAQALAETRLHPNRKLLITGHTDTTGSAEYNLPLSQQRADSVLAALVGDRDGWVKVALAKHKVEDYQLILKWVSLDRNWPCDPGKIDNTDGPATAAAIKAFQQRYNDDFGQSIAVDGIVGKETWGAFFDVYMKELAVLSDTDEAGLAGMRGHLQYVDDSKKAVGCGKNFPKDHRGVDEWRSRENRRVEICFFSPDQLPVMECHPGGGKCKAAVCQVNDPKVFLPTIIPVPPHQPKVGPIIQIDDLPPAPGA
ncbi:MAG: OmpA family protein, partial [Tepidisphaerales bacterium]